MFDIPASSPPITQAAKSSAPAAISTSAMGTALAGIVCWYVDRIQHVDVPPEIAILVAGVFTGALNFVAVLIAHFVNHRNDA